MTATLEDVLLAITSAFALAGQVPDLQSQLAAKQAEVEAANAQITALKAAAPTTPAPQPDPTPPPAPPVTVTFKELPVDGKVVNIAGLSWAAQTPRVLAGSDGSYRFSAKAGERANFDPPRKIRSEFVGLTRFGKGEEIRLKGTFNIDPASVFTGAEWCSIVQIHQWDTRRADGVPVNASPMFAMDLLPDPKTGKPFLQVRGETGRGTQPTFSPMRILGKLPDVTLGVDHTFDLRVVDGHGSNGRISVWIDGVALVDRSDIPTGYEYVDLLSNAFPIKGKPQETASYLKMGIYAGKGSGDAPPPLVSVAFTLRDLSSK
ncbi:heparin lyase I family protein [Methylobacterium thuringiense]|uniref:Uncharacterized protein n=1 Tax=Methylobacterium thuringiense TaxID=1003091 RepID=A0ABQ4TGS5_9HYPH|nr:heparin lyase I family protein [Methylobacterium thuringiense]GJE54595.1 hypothetical protein EKPJFOCH_1073 [Methylobacterium thuringiense]